MQAHLLEKARHHQVLIPDPIGLTTEPRPVVPLAGPHSAHSLPELGPRGFVLQLLLSGQPTGSGSVGQLPTQLIGCLRFGVGCVAGIMCVRCVACVLLCLYVMGACVE